MKKEIFDELHSISPLLAQKGKIGDGYKIPDNYFDRMTRQVMEQAGLIPQPELAKKRASWTAQLTDWMQARRSAGSRFGIATAIVFSLVAGAVWRTKTGAPAAASAAAAGPADQIPQYIAARPDEFDDAFILESEAGIAATDAQAGENKNGKAGGSVSADKDDLEKMLREELQDEALSEAKL